MFKNSELTLQALALLFNSACLNEADCFTCRQWVYLYLCFSSLWVWEIWCCWTTF